MFFSISNALATFQGYINKILAENLNIFMIVYLDDILINTQDLRLFHIEIIHWILDQLWKYSFFANLKKCWFYQDEVHFLGYVILSKKINMEAKKIKVVKNWLEPKSVCNI